MADDSLVGNSVAAVDDGVCRIDADANVDEFFRDVVAGALTTIGIDASAASQSYVVSLLAESARPNSPTLEVMGRSSLTLMLADALASSGSERFHRLRLVGDGVLFVSGFFGAYFAKRGVAPGYVRGLGATAYHRAAAMLGASRSSPAAPDLFLELADNFEGFVELLSVVSEELKANAVQDASSLLDAYERWLEEPRDSLARFLVSHGVLPARRPRGVN